MKSPRLTIGLPFYNAGDTLVDALRCIFAQTFTDWELIMIDDGSTDGSLEIAEKVNDPRVRVVSDGANKKLAARLNQINRLARGQLIARFDADDLCDPTRLARQVDFLDSRPDVDVVGTARLSLGPNDEVKGRRNEPATHAEICRRPLSRGVYICHGSIVARKEWFDKHPYAEHYRLAQDGALWLSSWFDSTFANLTEALYFYREFETYSFGKYYRSKKANIMALWEFGMKSAGLLPVMAATALVVARVCIFGVLTVLGVHNLLVTRRSHPPDEQDVQRFRQALEIIRSTKVPGLDDT